MSASYIVHDNGARPFKVVVLPAHPGAGWQHGVLVLGRRGPEPDGEDTREYTEVVATLEAATVMADGGYERGYAPAVGNTVLVCEATPLGAPLSYVWIGARVMRFCPPEPITAYCSMIGNSDVPYPLGLSANYVWFFAPSLPCGDVYHGPLGVRREQLSSIRYTPKTLAVHESALYSALYGINGYPKPGLQPGALRCDVTVLRRRPGWEEIEDRQAAYVPGGSDSDND